MGFSAAELQRLGEVLSGYDFEIPDYQRGYAWNEPQWKSLWQDIQNIAKAAAQQHFTGMMLLRPCEQYTSLPHVEVVDGQQRLVTAMILANTLRLKSRQQIVRYRLTFKDNEELQNHFKFFALSDNSVEAQLSHDPSSYAINLQKATKYFAECVADLTAQQAEDLLKVLLDNFCLFILEVSTGFDIHIAFETLNSRGRRLSQMELLKNRLIYLTTVLKDDLGAAEKLRNDIHAAWKGIYRSLGRSTKTQNHDDEFLLAHTTSYFKKKREAEWLDKTLFESTFALSNKELSFDLIRDYMKSLELGAAWWSHIHAPDCMPKAHQKLLDRIAHAGFAYFKPLLLSAYMRATKNLPGAALHPADQEDALMAITDLLIQVERFIVIVFRLLGNKGGLGKADMDGAAHTLLQSAQDGYLAEEHCINTLSSQEAIQLVASFVKAWVDNSEQDDGTFTDNRFQWSGAFTPDELQRAIERRFRDGEGYYKWDFTRIALYEYEESFRDDGKNAVKVSWDDFSFDETVEHIYPQTPDGKEYWSKHFTFDGRSNRNGRISKALQNSIGNLLFLSRSANSSISNEGYVVKENNVEVGKRAKFMNASYSATEVAQTFKKWDAESIAIRGVAILKFVEERWDIALTNTPNNRKSYLPLCFGAEAESIIEGKAGKKILSHNLKDSLKPKIAEAWLMSV
jgi:uncharacterized protein with ParB-like and HNH nuclease domain